jgi:hypothetical protein
MNTEMTTKRRQFLDERYVSSLMFQIQSITDLGEQVTSVLEVGPGGGTFKLMMDHLGYKVLTTDIVADFEPDYLGDFRDIEIDMSFDLVAGFEVLQHMRYLDFVTSLRKMAELSKRYVFISLPAQVHSFNIRARFPRLLVPSRLGIGRLQHWNSVGFNWEWPRARDIPEERFADREDHWNPHYWEVGRKSYPKQRILDDVEKAGLRIMWNGHGERHPYHYFLMLEKVGGHHNSVARPT